MRPFREQAPPRGHVRAPPDQIPGLIEEPDFDRKAHAEGVDRPTPRDQQARSRKALIEKRKAEQPATNRRRDGNFDPSYRLKR